MCCLNELPWYAKTILCQSLTIRLWIVDIFLWHLSKMFGMKMFCATHWSHHARAESSGWRLMWQNQVESGSRQDWDRKQRHYWRKELVSCRRMSRQRTGTWNPLPQRRNANSLQGWVEFLSLNIPWDSAEPGCVKQLTGENISELNKLRPYSTLFDKLFC